MNEHMAITSYLFFLLLCCCSIARSALLDSFVCGPFGICCGQQQNEGKDKRTKESRAGGEKTDRQTTEKRVEDFPLLFRPHR